MKREKRGKGTHEIKSLIIINSVIQSNKNQEGKREGKEAKTTKERMM